MNILVLNCGSSTIKFQLISTDRDAMRCDGDCRLARGVIERVGGEAVLTLHTGSKPASHFSEPLRDIRAAVDYIIRWVVSPGSGIDTIQSLSQIHAVGHRVVHGGERFTLSRL